MPQFFIDAELSAGWEVELTGSEAKHISQVLRLKEGDWIVLSDGKGSSYRAEILESRPGHVNARLGEKIARSCKNDPPVLALAVIKGDRFEWAIQKVVELGCKTIIPFRSERSVPQYTDDASDKKLERWRRIAFEAAKQSGLPFKPQVEAITDFPALCKTFSDYRNAIFFYEGESGTGVKSILQQIDSTQDTKSDLVVIGPEGGFAPAEVAMAKTSGAKTAGLGAQILRVETAAIATLAIWQYEFGNMNP